MKILPLLIFGLTFLTSVPAADAMNNKDIVVSIKPLHSLVANITAGVTRPHLLLRPPASPHSHVLKPSDASALSNARIIFWMGPQVETFLQKPLASLSSSATIVSFPRSDNGDPHIWLDPAKARNIAQKITSTLMTADPQNASHYQKNLQELYAKLEKLHNQLAATLANSAPIFVFHNAYSHLAKRYHINIVGIIAKNPELASGAKHIRQVRQKLKSSKVKCVFSEPQFNRRIINTITTGTKVKIATLDPLGSNLTAGPGHYFEMMQQLANSIASCR